MAPFLSQLAFKPARFRAGGHGTQISFRLSKQSNVTLTFERIVGHHRRAGGHLTITRARAGTTRIRFTGRLGRKLIPAGSYHVTARPSGGNTTRALRLTVLGAKP